MSGDDEPAFAAACFFGALVFAATSFLFEEDRSTGWSFSPPERGGLRVVTWNVGGSSGSGGTPLRSESIEHVVTTLRELDPHLAFLQEIAGPRQFDELLDRLGSDWHGRVSSRGTRRVAVVTRKARLSELDLNLDRDGRVLGVVARLRDRPRVTVIALHADAYSSGRRNTLIGSAAALLQGRDSRECKILLGDFNLDLDLDKRRDLFTDDEHRDVETYNFVAKELVDAARGRGTTAEPDRRLDYVFVSPHNFEVKNAGPYKDQRVSDMDHDPVVADLTFRD